MINVAELVATLGFDSSEFDKGMDSAETKSKTFDQKIQDNSKTLRNVGIGATIAGGAIVGAFGLATNASVDFETGISEVFTLLPGLSADARDQMIEDVRAFSSEMGTTTDKTIPALYQAISAGVPKENVFEFLKTANQAAIGGVTELETAVDGITSVINAYGTDVISAGETSDLMFTAVKLGKTNFEELSGSLFNVIPKAKDLGVNFGDITAAIATMTAQGTPTKIATTQLRQALVELSKDGSETSDTFKELSGKSFKDFIASGGNLQDALKIMEAGAADLGIGIGDLFGSVEAGNAVLALTGKGTEKFSSDLEAMSTATGATEEAANTMEDTAGRTIDHLMSMFEDLKLELGDVFLPVLKDQILPVLKDLLGVFGGLPDWMKPVILMIGGLGAALVIVGPLLVALPGIIGAIGVAFTILSANPIILVIGGLILLLIWLQSEFDILGIAIDVITGIFGVVSDAVGGFIGWIQEGIEWISNAVDWTKILSDAFKFMGKVIGAVGDFIGGVFDTIVGTVKGAINWVIDGINMLIRGLNLLHFDVPDWVPFIGGQSVGFSLPEIPRLAEGGIATDPTLAMIGESGPEAVIPLDQGFGGVTITGNTFNVRDDQDIELVAQELYTLINRKNRGRGTL